MVIMDGTKSWANLLEVHLGAAKRRKGLAAGKAIGFDVGAGLVQLRRGKGIFDFVALALVTHRRFAAPGCRRRCGGALAP